MIVSEAQVQRVVRIYQAQGAQRIREGTSSARPRPDMVTLSREARAKQQEVQKIREALKGMPDVREAKVAELRKAIESGTYRIDSSQIAEKMVARFLVDRLAAGLPATQDAETAPGGKEGR